MSKIVLAGGSSSYTVEVDVSAKIVNSGDNATVTITVTGNLREGYWVQSSGVMFASSCDGQTKGNTSLLGNTNGGTTHSSDSNPYTATHTYSVSRASARTISWSVDVYGSYDMSAKTSATNFSGTLDVTAAVTYYTVTWKDGLGNKIETDTVASGGSATPPSDPTRTGYTFAGWDSSYTNITSNKTINAKWTEHYLTVNYYSNYATKCTLEGDTVSGVASDKNIVVCIETYYYDNSYSDGLNNVQNSGYLYLERAGYSPTGYWGTTTSGGTLVHQSTSYTTGQALAEAFGESLASGNASVDIYAQWTANTYTLTYNANGGKLIVESEEVEGAISYVDTLEESVVFDTTKFVTKEGEGFCIKEGSNFLGWIDENGVDWTAWINTEWLWTGEDYARDVTLYAQWDDNVEYTVTFDLKGGTSDEGSGPIVRTVTSGSSAAPPSNVKKSGKEFKGWAGSYTNVTSSRTVYAIYDGAPLWIMTSDGWQPFKG